jgi:hypothetical protein
VDGLVDRVNALEIKAAAMTTGSISHRKRKPAN